MFGCCKTFSGKYIFSGNANFWKRKMFPCVWLHFKKFSGKYFLVFGKKEGKHKSENTSHNPEKKNHQRRKCFQFDDCRIDGAISRRSRSCLREIAPSIAILDRDRAVDRDLGLELELAISDWIFSSCARARALSLSLSFSGNALKEK